MKIKSAAALAAGGTAVLLAFALSHRPAPPAIPRHTTAAQKPQTVARPLLTHAQLIRLRPNEVGRIPILMYHAVGASACGGRPRYDVHGLNIAPDTFRKQLTLMRDAGWYPVNMRDVLTARLDVPLGKTPVVLTFDDARGSQFRYDANGLLDPNCAVGILEAFHKAHTDWPLRATFYVLPKWRWNPAPFWQPGKETQKLRFLVSQGFEVANHTTTHRSMARMDAHTLCWELAGCAAYVWARAPNATMDTMALPGGAVPRNHALWRYLLAGRDGSTSYQNRCVLMAWGGPAYAFTDRRFNPERVARIGTLPGAVERWLQRSRRRASPGFYISDGDPATVTVPRSQLANLDRHRLQGAQLLVYNDTARKA